MAYYAIAVSPPIPQVQSAVQWATAAHVWRLTFSAYRHSATAKRYCETESATGRDPGCFVGSAKVSRPVHLPEYRADSDAVTQEYRPQMLARRA